MLDRQFASRARRNETKWALILSFIAIAGVTVVPRPALANTGPTWTGVDDTVEEVLVIGIVVTFVGAVLILANGAKPLKPTSPKVAPRSSRTAAADLCFRF